MIRRRITHFIKLLIPNIFFALFLLYSTIIVKFYNNLFLLAMPVIFCLLLMVLFTLTRQYRQESELQAWPYQQAFRWLIIITGFAIVAFLIHYVIYFWLG